MVDTLEYFVDSPTPQNTAERVLLSIHQHEVESFSQQNSSKSYNKIERYNESYLHIPLIIDAKQLSPLLQNELDDNLCNIILSYLGVVSIKIIFYPQNAFKSFTINVLYGMTFHEINALINTYLFMNNPKLKEFNIPLSYIKRYQTNL